MIYRRLLLNNMFSAINITRAKTNTLQQNTEKESNTNRQLIENTYHNILAYWLGSRQIGYIC